MSKVRVAIVDEGQGFDTSQSLDGHYGLSIMRERAESVGGSLTIESAENNMNLVQCTFSKPIKAGSAHPGTPETAN